MSVTQSEYVLITDIGSTTTKALLLGNKNGKFIFLGQAEVPTTVEKPFEDVKTGILSAARKLEEDHGVKLVDSNALVNAAYLTTSSAGGGLQMLVFGLTKSDTGHVAGITAHGAGGVILRTLTIDDEILPVDKMRLIRDLHPDLILMAGGIDGGAIGGVVHLAELLTLAEPEPKFRQNQKIPLVFCGNKNARYFISRVLQDRFELHIVDNVRPATTEVNTEPAKNKIHQLFMENVMERAPGYDRLKRWVSADILPTPTGVERILRLYAETNENNILMLDMGGATTDIFSNISGEYHRTVAANIGMSYSLSNILAQAGIDAVMRRLPRNFPEQEVRDYVANKTLHPAYVPKTLKERMVEISMAIEGINIAWHQHKEMNFRTVKLGFLDRLKKRDIDKFEAMFSSVTDELFQLSEVDMIIGAGGVISHMSNPLEALVALSDGFKPTGITRIFVDRSFKSPHMGALSASEPEIALELFKKECLQEIGYLIAPAGKAVQNKNALEVHDQENSRTFEMKWGDVKLLPKGGNFKFTPLKNCSLNKSENPALLRTGLPVMIDCRGRDKNLTDIPISYRDILDWPGDSEPFRSEVHPSSPEMIYGNFKLERRLPYEGQIFVRKGDGVSPGTIVGENRFGPPRMYVINIRSLVGYDRELTEEDIEKGLLVKPGDKIKVGQKIFALRSGGLVNFEYLYRSQVRGIVTLIEKHGIIVVREIQDYDGKPHKVKVSKEMEIKPKHLPGHLRFKTGDFIEKGQILAKDIGKGIFVKSPATGIIKNIDTIKGTVTVQYDINPVQLKAGVYGTITAIKENLGVKIEGRGHTIHGIIGFGGESYGEITLLQNSGSLFRDSKDKIVVTFDPVNTATLRNASEEGIAGLIAPSITNKDWVNFYGHEIGVALTGDEDIPFVLILTEGFGNFKMASECAEFLRHAQGKTASLSGRTQIRAGVMRPRIIINERP